MFDIVLTSSAFEDERLIYMYNLLCAARLCYPTKQLELHMVSGRLVPIRAEQPKSAEESDEGKCDVPADLGIGQQWLH